MRRELIGLGYTVLRTVDATSFVFKVAHRGVAVRSRRCGHTDCIPGIDAARQDMYKSDYIAEHI